MAVNYGQEIRKVLKKRGMTVAEFARRIHKSRENAYDIFTRKSVDTDLLRTISQVLEYDFLDSGNYAAPRAYSENRRVVHATVAEEPAARYGKLEKDIFLLREDMLMIRKEILELRNRITAIDQMRKGSKSEF